MIINYSRIHELILLTLPALLSGHLFFSENTDFITIINIIGKETTVLRDVSPYILVDMN